ncbi:MAG: Lrp/AsnC ligand binding domain-containing protein [Candidatus Bathyarchaeota archaeon]|jgi:DNA-binding Lrp family transcriptional regulator
MPIAFVLINTETGLEADMLQTLSKVEGVNEVHVVYGTYDIVAKVEAESMKVLKEMITLRIRKLDKIRSTLTLIVTRNSNAS